MIILKHFKELFKVYSKFLNKAPQELLNEALTEYFLVLKTTKDHVKGGYVP